MDTCNCTDCNCSNTFELGFYTNKEILTLPIQVQDSSKSYFIKVKFNGSIFRFPLNIDQDNFLYFNLSILNANYYFDKAEIEDEDKNIITYTDDDGKEYNNFSFKVEPQVTKED